MKRLSTKLSLGLGLVVLSTQMAAAHTGHGAHGIANGFAHPFLGLDHLLAMLAVGLIAARKGGHALWLMPASFMLALLAGGMIGFAGFELSFMEAAIMASLVVFAGMLVFANAMPMLLTAGVIAGFGLFHGFAHGLEIPQTASGIAYAAGFVAASGLLHGIGIALVLIGRKALRFA